MISGPCLPPPVDVWAIIGDIASVVAALLAAIASSIAVWFAWRAVRQARADRDYGHDRAAAELLAEECRRTIDGLGRNSLTPNQARTTFFADITVWQETVTGDASPVAVFLRSQVTDAIRAYEDHVGDAGRFFAVMLAFRRAQRISRDWAYPERRATILSDVAEAPGFEPG